MSCHLCSNEAIDRCFTCGRLVCADHGAKNCAACQGSFQPGDPSFERVSVAPPRTGQDAAWWRPQKAEEYVPPACYVCRGLTRAVCAHCGRYYCAEHAGRNFSCKECNTASNVSLYVVGAFLLVFASIAVLTALLRH